MTENFDEAVVRLRKIFVELKIEIKAVQETSECHQWELTATSNTWTNQRRKRRAEQTTSQAKSSTEAPKPKDLCVAFEIRKEAGKACIQMFYLSGSMNKDCVNQILQFIKNKFK